MLTLASPAVSDAAAITTTQEVASLPATNLLTPQPGEVWRTTDLAGAAVELDLGLIQPAGTEHPIRQVWLGYTNATSAATWRIRAAASQANLTAAPDYDSGSLTQWPATGLESWGRRLALLHLAVAELHRWWRVDVADAANPDGYLEAGRLILADPWEVSPNMDPGWSIQMRDTTARSRSLGGTGFAAPGGQWRDLALVLRHMSESDAFSQALAFDRLRGGSRPVLAIPDPANTARLMDQIIYGRLAQRSAVAHQARTPNSYTTSYRISEVELP